MSNVAMVAVKDASIYYDKLYSYIVPGNLEESIFVGSMVVVPFGRGKAHPRIGAVIEMQTHAEPPQKLKEIIDVAKENVYLNEELLGVVRYLKDFTFCTWYEAIKAVIPYGAQHRLLQTDTGWKLEKKIKQHTLQIYKLNQACFANCAEKIKLSEKQHRVVEFIGENSFSADEICVACSVTKAVLQTMLKKQYLLTFKQDKETEISGKGKYKPEDIVLSPAQQQVYNTVISRAKTPQAKPILLHGVTGSGKTPVFICLLHHVLRQGKTALVLVPEIGLTPQMVDRLQQNFGTEVAIQHSALSNTERLLQWRQIQRGEAKIVVGTRSAIFAPLNNIGMLIIDEEQEHTYHSESSPRYDAIEIARRRARYHGAMLLLASATPSVADYYHAVQSERYEKLELKERFGGVPLPSVEMVDMRGELLSSNTGVLSKRLAEEIAINIEKKEQTILLLNRRGYNTVALCSSCRAIIKCDSCSVPMVYHKKGNRLLCHYCGKSHAPPPQTCPECGGEIRYTGFGTQRLQEELEEHFKDARILRMDLDTTGKKGAHEKSFRKFGNGEYDILVGTQMVAKGLDFENVSLVGIIGIDSLLFSQGYRSFETVFSLVTQVVGRSGRGSIHGRALVQTHDPDNHVLNLAAQQDYAAFYQQEILLRKFALYPPFCSLCVIGFIATDELKAASASRQFGEILMGKAKQCPNLPLRVLGPAPMNIVQVADTYRYKLTLKCRADKEFLDVMREVLEEYNKKGLPRKASIFIDFNTDG